MCAAIIVMQSVFLIGAHVKAQQTLCGFLAFAVYFSVLAEFCWLLLHGLRIHGKIKKIFASNLNIEIVYVVIGWGLPTLLALIAIGVQIDLKNPDDVCWEAAAGSAMWGYAGPVIIIAVFNVAVLLKLLIPTEDVKNGYDYEEMRFRVIKDAIFLACFGLTCTFAYQAVEEERFTEQYFLSVFVVLQAIAMFVFGREGRKDFIKRVEDPQQDEGPANTQADAEEEPENIYENIEDVKPETDLGEGHVKRPRKRNAPNKQPEKITVNTLKNLNIYKEGGSSEMDPLQHAAHLGMMAKRAMQLRDYPDALRMLSMGLTQLQPLNCPPQVASPFLVDRAECLWQLGNVQASLHDMENALRFGLPRDDYYAEEESLKWSDHGHALLQNNDFPLAEQCANFAFYFQTSPRARAQACHCRALAQYEMGKAIGAKNDINEMKRLDGDLARSAAQQRKDIAFASFQKKDYIRSIKDFNLAILLHPEDGSKMKFNRSVQSHQATAYFKLNLYKKAVELGEESFKSNPFYRSKEEAERWKERGNQFSKEASSVDLAIACYSLALNFTPEEETFLKATILSNRSMMYKKQDKVDEALKDAQECVNSKPDWHKAQYRLGSSLCARKKYSEALKPFSKSLKLQLMLSDSTSSEKDKVDTLTQILSVALKIPDGTSSIQYSIPQPIIQSAMNKAVADKDWDLLHLLFLGGGGQKQFKKGSGGLATGCDASSVPLEEVIRCDFPDLKTFISILLEHKANANPPKGSKNPVDVAIELENVDLANLLMDRSNTPGADVKTGTSKPLKKTFRSEGLEAVRRGEDSRAIVLLQISLKHDGATVDEQREMLQLLCELYFKQKSFNDCLCTGRKLKDTYKGEKNETKATAEATQWKKWGNELHKENKYDLMAEYYTLALEFTPPSKSEIMTALLSNRCLALINLKKFNEALVDAEKCTKIRPKWFRGHSRHGTCLLHLKRNKDALQAFCKAHTCALNDKEKQATAQEVISTAMNIEGGESQITCPLSPQVLQFLVKGACEKNEWKKLRFLYLGTAASKTSRGLATECDASCVPLDLLIESDVNDLHKLVTVLLEHGASPTGLRGCAKAPLLAAMETMKFPLAVTLLKNNADPSCIVGHGVFINREGQPKQWLQLGRKALDAKDNKKAIMLLNMSLYLSDSSTEQAILPQVHHALAEVHFNLNEHERSIDSGKECFKLRPIKSEEEANRWKDRAAHAFKSSNYNVCIDYVNLALKYTPADSKQTFSLLLCQRSEASQRLGDCEHGLDDAKNASMMNPGMLEGYLNQLYCFKELKRERDAMQVINECLKRTSDDNLMYGLLSDALDMAVNLQEATSAFTAPVPKDLLTELTSNVIKKRDWRKLRALYLGGGGPTSQPVGDGGLATGIDASSVPLGEIISSTIPERLPLISALLKYGASANAIEGSDIIPLDEATRLQNLPLVEKLVHNGANSCVVGKDGGPIIHQALRIGLQNGTFRFLEAMLASKLPEIESVQDANGDTLYHLACYGKMNKKSAANKCKAIRILREANINPNLPNKTNRSPIEMLNKRDPRWKMLDTALGTYRSNSSVSSPPGTNPENTSNEEHNDEFLLTATEGEGLSGGSDGPLTEEVTPDKDIKVSKIEDKQQLRLQMRENVASLIDALLPLTTFVSVDANEEHDDNEIFNEPPGVPQVTENDDGLLKDEIGLQTTEEDDGDIDGSEIGGDHDAEVEIDSKSPFEDLPWEVDCTDRVWKVMRSKRWTIVCGDASLTKFAC
ncbi:TPR and ankyrin repeat-containing protein 1 [Desmophyllum pertusum]|uniref:TPR and ankyrin repeat-containing protein 1 n=1 Tax=Desmophyllum pertusum TaxID=174260 RepID=A0A9W9YYM0_9CNID|nr:TPR and ankyrin repeat-containing protein 1 [Desmophyllum pertusum]